MFFQKQKIKTFAKSHIFIPFSAVVKFRPEMGVASRSAAKKFNLESILRKFLGGIQISRWIHVGLLWVCCCCEFLDPC